MDKKNNNILKQYKKKYTTKDRLDMSKGGRVKAAVGGLKKAPINRRRPPMSIQKEEEPKELKPIQPVKKKPIQKTVKQVPKKAVQPGNLTTGGLGRDRILPTGPSKAPVNTGRPIQRGGVGGITAKPAPKAPPGYLQKVGGGFQKIIPNVNSSTSQTGIENKGIPNLQKPISKAQKELNEMNIAQQKALQTQSNQEKRALELAQAGQQPAQPIPSERGTDRRMTGREELGLANPSLRSDTIEPRLTNTLARFIPGQPTASRSAVPGATKGEAELIKETGGLRQAQAFQKSPTTGKGSDQMFIGREGDVQPQAAQAMSARYAR